MPHCIFLLFVFHLILNFKFKFKCTQKYFFFSLLFSLGRPIFFFSFSLSFLLCSPAQLAFSFPSFPPARPGLVRPVSPCPQPGSPPAPFSFLSLLHAPPPPARAVQSLLLLFCSLTDGPYLSGPSSPLSQTRTQVRVRPAPSAVLHREGLRAHTPRPQGPPYKTAASVPSSPTLSLDSTFSLELALSATFLFTL
jgi:hypothetical protein